MDKIMKATSIDYLEKIIKAQSEFGESGEAPIIYTHVEGYEKDSGLYELRVFIALGKYIKDISIDAAFACEYTHNNKRLFYQAKSNEDPEQAVAAKISEVLFDGQKDALSYMKI